MCPACRKPITACVCAEKAQITQKGDGIVRVSRETKGRGGKAVTLIRGLDLPTEDLAALGKQIRTACGSGGTVKDRVIEVQGDHCDRVIDFLTKHGRIVKRAGG